MEKYKRETEIETVQNERTTVLGKKNIDNNRLIHERF
jgi:hypothetical protein